MPLVYLRRLTGRERTNAANQHLARYLAFVAGAANAGGFLAFHQYTSHMSGVVSSMADNLALGSLTLVLNGFLALFSFLFGATSTSIMIRWARRRKLHSEFALPLLLEAALLIVFGLIGHEFEGHIALGPITLLCFTMGLQNAMITKISGAVIRTTHLTGMVTDVGIELGRLALANKEDNPSESSNSTDKLRLLSSLIGLFFLGGVTGALGFKRLGFLFTLPLSAVLLVLAAMPVIDDLRNQRRHKPGSRYDRTPESAADLSDTDVPADTARVADKSELHLSAVASDAGSAPRRSGGCVLRL
jgi:uncharacterized membrane protein YoaK (UPF0700 family)